METERRQPEEKICAICGQDCSDRPRTRDPKGRYFCTVCYKKASAAQPAPEDSADTASLTSTGTAESLTLLDTALDESSAAPACQGCGTPLEPTAVVCTSCGLDLQTGRFVEPVRGGPVITKVQTVRGPSRWDRVVAHHRAEASKAAFWHIAIPLAMLGAGFGVMTGLIGLPGVDMATQTAGSYALTLTVEVIVGVAALWGAAALWLGGVGPLPLAVLRLAGVFAVVDALAVMLAPLIALAPFASVDFIVQAGLLLALLGWQFDLNLREAVLLGLVTFGLKLGAGALLASILG